VVIQMMAVIWSCHRLGGFDTTRRHFEWSCAASTPAQNQNLSGARMRESASFHPSELLMDRQGVNRHGSEAWHLPGRDAAAMSRPSPGELQITAYSY